MTVSSINKITRIADKYDLSIHIGLRMQQLCLSFSQQQYSSTQHRLNRKRKYAVDHNAKARAIIASAEGGMSITSVDGLEHILVALMSMSDRRSGDVLVDNITLRHADARKKVLIVEAQFYAGVDLNLHDLQRIVAENDGIIDIAESLCDLNALRLKLSFSMAVEDVSFACRSGVMCSSVPTHQ
jgi:hypothetical protein